MASPSMHGARTRPSRPHLTLVVDNERRSRARSRFAPVVGVVVGILAGGVVGAGVAAAVAAVWPGLDADPWALLLPVVWFAAGGAVLGWFTGVARGIRTSPDPRPARRGRRPRTTSRRARRARFERHVSG